MKLSGIDSTHTETPQHPSFSLSQNSVQSQRIFVICNSLPIDCDRIEESTGTSNLRWKFTFRRDSLLTFLPETLQGKYKDYSRKPKDRLVPQPREARENFQRSPSLMPQTRGGILHHGYSEEFSNAEKMQLQDLFFFGLLDADIETWEEELISSYLIREFNCIPIFVDKILRHSYYHGFCETTLWPLFHSFLPSGNVVNTFGCSKDSSSEIQDSSARSAWQAYLTVNKLFSQKILESVNPTDYIWIHDYHLLVLPSYLRKRFHNVRIGFFLHVPFPSSEIFRALPTREEVLRGILNADLIGFNTFDYARHFLSCCSRMLGLEVVCTRGRLELDYYGRRIALKIIPVGISVLRIQERISSSIVEWRRGELSAEFKGKRVFLGVDDLDPFKGVPHKLLAFEHLLDQQTELVGKIVLVQVLFQGHWEKFGNNENNLYAELRSEILRIAVRVNHRFSKDGYVPIHCHELGVPEQDLYALYAVADAVVLTALRDGMNLVPYEYTAVRGLKDSDSVIILSEFVGCSPSLSGAIRVNPWSVESIAAGMLTSLNLSSFERSNRHTKHQRYVVHNTVTHWSHTFVSELKVACKYHDSRTYYGLGLGLNFRVVSLDPDFKKLDASLVLEAMAISKTKAIFLDYDGTVQSVEMYGKPLEQEVGRIIDSISRDPSVYTFIVSGRTCTELSEWFRGFEFLGLIAEYGFWTRWDEDCCWEPADPEHEFSWKQVVLPVLQAYTECTDGSYVEEKETGLVWHFGDADPDFGAMQSKELISHLEGMLGKNKTVDIIHGGTHGGYVEVKPKGCAKGSGVDRILSVLEAIGRKPEFILCIGDDKSDEDMFHVLDTRAANAQSDIDVQHVFSCTVGRKPSRARYYLNDTTEVIELLDSLTKVPAA